MFLEHLSPQVQSLFIPGILYIAAASSYLQVLFAEVKSLRIPNLAEVRSEGFSRFWNLLSESQPTSEDQLEGSAVLVPPLLATASGQVLDIGPGSGSTIQYFNKSSSIQTIIGAEPSAGLHASLRKSIHAAKLDGKYQIITAEASADSIRSGLQMAGIKPTANSSDYLFDTIVCIRVLCSVPNPRDTIRDLHGLLKPGGKLMVIEHTVNPWNSGKGSVIARLLQTFYMAIGWSFFVGDCSLVRDTYSNLIDAVGPKGWSDVQLDRHFGFAVLPYISGTLTKA